MKLKDPEEWKYSIPKTMNFLLFRIRFKWYLNAMNLIKYYIQITKQEKIKKWKSKKEQQHLFYLV